MQSTFSATVVESSAKCLEILQSYLEKSGNFILPNLWEPWMVNNMETAEIKRSGFWLYQHLPNFKVTWPPTGGEIQKSGSKKL